MKLVIKEPTMTRAHVVPEDFPREPSPGVVPGMQPKLLVRETDGRYYTGLTDEELWTRYDACEDLASQLAEYVSQKISVSGLSPDDALGRVQKGLKAKVGASQWDFSPAEIAWVMKRTRELLPIAAGRGGRGG
jgi:hypothetical protein